MKGLKCCCQFSRVFFFFSLRLCGNFGMDSHEEDGEIRDEGRHHAQNSTEDNEVEDDDFRWDYVMGIMVVNVVYSYVVLH